MLLQVSTAAYLSIISASVADSLLIAAHASSGHVALPASLLLNTCPTDSTAAVAFGFAVSIFTLPDNPPTNFCGSQHPMAHAFSRESQ